MAEILSLTNIARIQYLQFFSLGALFAFKRTRDFFFDKLIGHPAGTDGLENLLHAEYAFAFISLGAFFLAVSQFDSADAQRKALLYTYGAYIFAPIHQYSYNVDYLPVVAAWSILNVALLLVAVYVVHPAHDEVQEKTGGWLKLAIRLTYVLIFVSDFFGSYLNVMPTLLSKFLSIPNALTSNNLYHLRMMASFKIILAVGLAGAAQLNNANMKKTVQCLLLFLLIKFLVMITFAYLFRPDIENVFSVMKLICGVYVQACDPAKIRKFLFRLYCIFSFSAAYHGVMATDHFIATEFRYLMPYFSDALGKIVTLNVFLLGLIYVAMALSDEESHQKFVLFTLTVYCIRLLAVGYYFNHFECESFFCIVDMLSILLYDTLGLHRVKEWYCSDSSASALSGRTKAVASPSKAVGKPFATSSGRKKNK